MRIEITKGERADRIRVNRPDGTVLDYAMPKKGPVPHDAVHYFVERALGLADAFWGMIARGCIPMPLPNWPRRQDTPAPSAPRCPMPALSHCFRQSAWWNVSRPTCGAGEATRRP